MRLFERFHLSQEEAESRLKRALTRDPTRGEIALPLDHGMPRLRDQARLRAEEGNAGAAGDP